jgi:hypothetical protein
MSVIHADEVLLKDAGFPGEKLARGAVSGWGAKRGFTVDRPRGCDCTGSSVRGSRRSAQPVELEVAAVEEELPKLLARVNPRFRS